MKNNNVLEYTQLEKLMTHNIYLYLYIYLYYFMTNYIFIVVIFIIKLLY